jgi:ABC-type lipoprotein export system ATPase subunit
VFLADEPTGELDAATADQVYAVLGELVREHRCTTVVVSHDPESSRIADRIIRIRDGRVSEEWARDEDAGDTIVVGRGGWLRLPEELLLRAGIGGKATARFADGAVVVEPSGERAAQQVADAVPVSAIPSGPVVAEARSLSRRFSDQLVFEDLSLELRAGRLHAITGPSGSGKTTLLHLLAGLDLPSAGEIVVLGERIDELDRTRRAAFRRDRLALVAQEPPLVPFLSVRENVELFLGLRGLDGGNGQARETLAVVGLEQLLEQRVSRLSTGEQERVAIARALASEPDLLLADEPTARLDYANALAIGELLSRIARERGIAVVCATHDPAVIEQADAELSLVS